MTTKRINKYAPYASSYERDYAKHLQLRKRAGEILGWTYACPPFLIGFDCRYKPDFMVTLNNGTVEMHEVKGYFRDDAKVKLMVAASAFPLHPFILVTWDKSTGWKLKRIKVITPKIEEG